ncbi:MAG: hypothetical protein HYZ37_07785 [Candidatus Solibacter usitatus]|nr:hypothetical protein [Candidatus Solibacter usitatus]
MNPTVAHCAYRHTTDIDPTVGMHSKEWDGLGNVCVSRATEVLRLDATGYSKEHRDQISDIFHSMAATNRTIRRILEPGQESESVDALALARLQLECLYTLCLMFEGSQHVDCYVRDYWRKLFVQYLLRREETSGLPRFQESASAPPDGLIPLGLHFGITQAQIFTVELEELNCPLPAGIAEERIPQFPNAAKSISKIPLGDKRRMLERLYMKYRELCSFAHSTAQANMFKNVFDKRSRQTAFLGDHEKEERFQRDILGESYLVSFLSISQSAAELTVRYPNDVELRCAAMNAWAQLSEASLLTKAVWEIRTKKLLGAIS